MIHVAHVMRTLGHGGMEKNLRRVALALEPRGVRQSIVLLSDREDLLPFPASIPIRRILTAPRDPRVIVRLARELRALKPTVIHARNWASWPDTAFARLLGAPRVPLVFSYHGMESAEVTATDRAKFKAMEKLTTNLFAVSHAARALLIEKLGLPADRIGVILNGVDTEKFRPGAEPSKPRPLIIGAVGRLFPIKNFPMLIRAIRRLLDQNLDVELHLAGDGPEGRHLVRLAEELRLGSKMIMRGYVEDMPGFLQDVDIFALSSDNEANPNALLEAMAAGRPCVSTDVGGAAEVLDRGRCGLLVPPGDDRAMAEGLRKLVQDPDLRDRLGRTAREHVVASYSQASMFDAYERLYRDPRRLW